MLLLGAATAVGPDMFVEIFLAVVVAELIPRFDILDGVDENTPPFYFRFAVGLTGMIDIPRDILTHRAVDRLPAMYLEEILAATAVLFGTRKHTADIFNDTLTFFVWVCREESEPSA